MRNLIREVINEATKLRELTTDVEKNNLRREVQVDMRSDCIYGQMTGHCDSDRALELLSKSAVPFSKYLNKPVEKKVSFTEERMYDDFLDMDTRTYFSPLEYYIAQEGAKIDPIVQFIKGERKTLKRRDLC